MVLVFQDVASDQQCLAAILLFPLSSSSCRKEIGGSLQMYIDVYFNVETQCQHSTKWKNEDWTLPISL